jgi:hypothetical protein
MEAASAKSTSYYNAAWQWVEDAYLKFFGENRTSYGVKGIYFIPQAHVAGIY